MENTWQPILIQTQALAAKLPDMGINPDKLSLLSFDDLLGTLAFLKRKCAEREE